MNELFKMTVLEINHLDWTLLDAFPTLWVESF